MLGVVRNTLANWLTFIKDTESNIARYDYKAGMREIVLNNIKIRIRDVFYYKSTLTIYENLISAISDFEYSFHRDNKFQKELISIFRKNYIGLELLTKINISRLLGSNDSYIITLGCWGERERFSKFLKLLVRIYMLDSKQFILNDIIKDSKKLIFKTLKDKTVFTKNIKKDFNIIVDILVALSKAKTYANEKKTIVSLTSLSKIMSKSNSRNLLMEKLNNGYYIRPIQVRRVIKE